MQADAAVVHRGQRLVVRAAGHIEFWLRVGNATRQIHGDDMLDYKISHWGD